MTQIDCSVKFVKCEVNNTYCIANIFVFSSACLFFETCVIFILCNVMCIGILATVCTGLAFVLKCSYDKN